ncbi:MAG: hypothetical protein ACMXYD_02840 [Candidatus Woesearchaeota archaeon]
MAFSKKLANLGVTVVASILLILLGIIYFMITIFVIKVGATWAGVAAADPSTIVLTAGIVTAAAMIGSALQE